MSFLATLKTDVSELVSKFDTDVLPYVDSLLGMLASQEGAVIMKQAIADIGLVATGNFAGAVASVGAAALATAPGLIEQDMHTVLLNVQTALQVVKATQGVQAPSDAETVTAMVTAAAAPAEAAPGTLGTDVLPAEPAPIATADEGTETTAETADPAAADAAAGEAGSA